MATTAEYGIGEFTFPRGWFMIATSEQVVKKPLALRFFGKDLVAYRGESGRVVVMDAYCPHMGTHIGKNETSYVVLDDQHVEGDSIRCPYHGWKFGPDGKCTEIPYSPAPIPESACIPAYPVQEWGGLVLMWNDDEGGEPNFDPHPLPEWDDPKWIKWKVDDLGELNCHTQEIIDNIVDKAHLAPIHGSMDMEVFENEFDGHVVRQILSAGHRTLADGDGAMTNYTWYTGPGILMSRMNGLFNSLMFICQTPVEDGSLHAWHGLMVEPPSYPPTEEEIAGAAEYQVGSLMALSQDLDVWANKRASLQIMQVVGDGPFGRMRQWYKQFFNPRADVALYHAKSDGKIVSKGTTSNPWPEKAK